MSFKFDPALNARLEDLRSKRKEIDNRIQDRHASHLKTNGLFLANVRNQIELLTTTKDSQDQRNRGFLDAKAKVVTSYKNEMSKVQRADWIHREERNNANSIIEKNYPRYAQEVKQKIFRDEQMLERKLSVVEESKNNVSRINEELKKLNEELHAKKRELIEEEERKLRTESILKDYLFGLTNISAEGGITGAKTEKHFLSDSKRDEESNRMGNFQNIEANKGDVGQSNRGTTNLQGNEPKAQKSDFSYGSSEFNAALGQIKSTINQKKAEQSQAVSAKEDAGRADQQGLNDARSTIKKPQPQQTQQQQAQSNLSRTIKPEEKIENTNSVSFSEKPGIQTKNEAKDSKSLGQMRAIGTQNSQRSNEAAPESNENEFGSAGTNRNLKDVKNTGANRNSPTMTGSKENKAGASSGFGVIGGGSFGPVGLAALKNLISIENVPPQKPTKQLTYHDDEIQDVEDI